MDMNIIDLIVFILIAFYCIRGMVKGLVLSICNIVSFFAAVFCAAKFYPIVSDFIMHTKIYEIIQQSIGKFIKSVSVSTIQNFNTNVDTKGIESVVDSLKVPDLIKSDMMESINIKNLINFDDIIKHLSTDLTNAIVNIFSIILIFFVVRLVIRIISIILDRAMRMPVLKQANRLGGGIFGVISGVIITYIVFAIITLLSPIEIFNPVIKLINQSLVGSEFYNNNLLLKILL